MGAAVEKLVIPWGAVPANGKAQRPPINRAGCHRLRAKWVVS